MRFVAILFFVSASSWATVIFPETLDLADAVTQTAVLAELKGLGLANTPALSEFNLWSTYGEEHGCLGVICANYRTTIEAPICPGGHPAWMSDIEVQLKSDVPGRATADLIIDCEGGR